MVLTIERKDFERVAELFQKNPDWDKVILNTTQSDDYNSIKAKHAVEVKVSDSANSAGM